MRAAPLADLMHPSWASALAPVAEQIRDLGHFLRSEVAAGQGYLPAGADIFRAFSQPVDQVRVLILGQDPYPTPGHAMGLSFSVPPAVRPLPGSLRNIFRELHTDLGLNPPATGDLTAWSERGVLLLNRVLSVRPGAPGSHRGRGWEAVTDQAIRALRERDQPLVAVLWGKDAQQLRPALASTPIVASAHPSPLSAHRGFLGSRPFSAVNALLSEQGTDSLDWNLPG